MIDDVIEMPEPLGLFAKQLFHRGSEYLEAFKIVHQDERLKYPTYYLLTHSLELFLKSYLAANNVSKRDLRSKNLAHNLDKLHKRCVDIGMPNIPNLEHFAREFQHKNSDHDFRYPTNYILRIPSPKLCLEVMEPLRDTLRPIIGAIAMRAQLDWANETAHLRGRKIRWSD